MEKWAKDEKAFRWWSQNRDGNLLLQLITPPAKTEMACFEGSRDPLRGMVGFHGNDNVAAPMVEFRYPATNEQPVSSAVLIAPFSGGEVPAYAATVRTKPRSSVQQLEIAQPGGGKDRIAWTAGLALAIDDSSPFTTDATFLWRREGTAKQFLLNGTYLRM